MDWGAWFKAAIVICGMVVSWLFGGFAMFVAGVIGLMIVDYITGLIAAGVKKELSSRTGAAGILKKVCILIVITLAAVLDHLLREYVNAELAVCLGAACFFYAGNELISILENLGRAGVPYPQKLKDIILVLNKKSDNIGK